jgi:cytoskeletal protein RodZ
MLNSMTKQYIVKQTIRIGDFVIPKIYQNIFKISLISFMILFVVTFIVSVISAGTIQYWHEWQWFS